MLVQQDAVSASIRVLNIAVADVPVRSELPKGWGVKSGPAVTVSSNGTTDQARAWTGEIVRVVTYAEFAPDARSLAAQLEAFLLDPAHVPGLTIYPAVGLSVVRDSPDASRWIAAFAVKAATNRKEP
jgi:hypothetical protein